ncbi:hypothetical protein Sjap_026125 [Stephania japonica]|uniref:Uncharacterized protein n=1 Tax=Stephania japonica TaxID=461633 RepID=A0AAP0E322_9MAGN
MRFDEAARIRGASDGSGARVSVERVHVQERWRVTRVARENEAGMTTTECECMRRKVARIPRRSGDGGAFCVYHCVALLRHSVFNLCF